MPPRVPQIQPEVPGIALPPQPELNPAGLAELSTRGTRALAGALDVGARTAQSIHAEHQRLQKVLTEEQDTLAATEAVNRYRLDAAQHGIDLKQDLSISGAEYAPKLEAYNQKNRDAIGKTLKTDGARLKYERAVSGVQTEAAIHARAEGLQMQLASVKSGADLAIQDHERRAVFARTPEERAQAVQKIDAYIDVLAGKGIYSANEAAARKVGSRGRIAKGRVQVAWQDPTQRPEILRQLGEGAVEGLPADDQLELRRTLQNQQHVDEERERTKDKRDQDERASAAEKDVIDAWRTGDIATARARLAEARRDISSTHYAQLEERIQQPPKPPPLENDRATMLRLQPQVYDVTNNPRTILPQVHAAFADGKLNETTHRVLANELQNRILAEDQRRERQQDRALAQRDAGLQERKFVYTQGKDLIEETFKTTGMFEKFDTVAQDAKTAALQDYYANTNPYAPKMTAQQWIASRLPEYRAQVVTKTNTRFTEITRSLVQANIPVQGDLKNPQTVGAVRSYLSANRGELIKKHGAEGFYDLAQQVREAEITANEVARIEQFRARGGSGPSAAPAQPAAQPSTPAKPAAPGQPGSPTEPFQQRQKSGGR